MFAVVVAFAGDEDDGCSLLLLWQTDTAFCESSGDPVAVGDGGPLDACALTCPHELADGEDRQSVRRGIL